MTPPGDMQIMGEDIFNGAAVTIPTYGAQRDLGVFRDLELQRPERWLEIEVK